MRIYENIKFYLNLKFDYGVFDFLFKFKDGLLAVNSAIALFLCYFELVMHAYKQASNIIIKQERV